MKNALGNVLKNILRDESGLALLWTVLFMGFVGVPTMTYMFNLSAGQQTANGSLQNALKGFVMSAGTTAMTSQSLAQGNPVLDPVQAQAEFDQLLANQLNLDPTTLNPNPGSPLAEAPLTNVFVYNGPFPYTYSVPWTTDTITLTTPSVVAAVKAPYKNPFGTGAQWVERWAAARVYPN